MTTNAFGTRTPLRVGSSSYDIYSLPALAKAGVASGLDALPFSIKVLLEAMLRNLDDELVTDQDVLRMAGWNASLPADPSQTLKQFRLGGSYFYQRTIGGSLGYFWINGSSNALYSTPSSTTGIPPSVTGSPKGSTQRGFFT